jgi:hypothetical protein
MIRARHYLDKRKLVVFKHFHENATVGRSRGPVGIVIGDFIFEIDPSAGYMLRAPARLLKTWRPAICRSKLQMGALTNRIHAWTDLAAALLH